VTPELDSISPTQVQAGNEVTVFLYGRGFGGSQQVYIEGICDTPCTATGTDTSISVNISTAGTFSGDHDVDIMLSDNQLLGDAQELSVLSCPTGMGVDGSRTTSIPLTAANMNNPAVLTGWGMLSYMTVSPSGSGFNWNGTVVQEQVSSSGVPTCPPAVVECVGNANFTVGAPVMSYAFYPNPQPVPVNEFADWNTENAPIDLLAGEPAGYSCQFACKQVFTCPPGGSTIGSFTITRTLLHSTINGKSVTVATATKN